MGENVNSICKWVCSYFVVVYARHLNYCTNLTFKVCNSWSVFSENSFPVHLIQMATSTLVHCQGRREAGAGR